MDASQLLSRRLLLVTGKGGVGKSTLAASLALAGSRLGRRTCLVEVEGRQAFSSIFSTAPWDFEEREFRPSLYGLSIDPEASLTEYLSMFYGAQRITKLVARTPAVEFATQAAPGIKDVLLIGKVKEMERRRRDDGQFEYDLIVVDAPPTGRIVNFLAAPDATTELVNVGPVRQQAQTVIDMLTDSSRTAVLLTTLLEEMPVTETADSIRDLTQLGVPLGPVLINRAVQPAMDDAALKHLAGMDREAVQRVLADLGIDDVDASTAEALLDTGHTHLGRLDLAERMRQRVADEIDLPSLELPFVADATRPEEIVTAIAATLEDRL
ncbi:Arsenical pump-driving ATPase [Euzebya pacifica]|uniref:Arsenical pump-driving ATPase n=1 Tax=Euzebya pacifica TaxID=1608957 RepID=A0A346XT17_9ACTN|nr:ArsA-related P-loop ATPase [Euzebya pacifica]AXV05364.1 Arsenical pump-driving ATPase [Euzebya pacifica]